MSNKSLDGYRVNNRMWKERLFMLEFGNLYGYSADVFLLFLARAIILNGLSTCGVREWMPRMSIEEKIEVET